MNADTLPVVGAWYLHCQYRYRLEVFNLDYEQSVIDVQDEFGSVFEIPMSVWEAAEVAAVANPFAVAVSAMDTVAAERTPELPSTAATMGADAAVRSVSIAA